jgi:glutamate/tyrosine decarboxylase-like PLP-dependent enzyme
MVSAGSDRTMTAVRAMRWRDNARAQKKSRRKTGGFES